MDQRAPGCFPCPSVPCLLPLHCTHPHPYTPSWCSNTASFLSLTCWAAHLLPISSSPICSTTCYENVSPFLLLSSPVDSWLLLLFSPSVFCSPTLSWPDHFPSWLICQHLACCPGHVLLESNIHPQLLGHCSTSLLELYCWYGDFVLMRGSSICLRIKCSDQLLPSV